MLERGKMDRDLVEFVVIDQLVPKEHLLRKIDAAVDFTQLYEMVEPLYSIMASRRKKPRCSSSNTVPTQRHRIMRLHFSKGGKRNRKLKRGIAPMLSKEGFCKALQMIKEQETIDEQFSKALDLVGNGHFVFGAENKYLLALRDVLKETVNDQYDYIDWWLYEATDDYTVWEADCTMKYCLKEPEALYDFITGTLKPVPVSSRESTSQQE